MMIKTMKMLLLALLPYFTTICVLLTTGGLNINNASLSPRENEKELLLLLRAELKLVLWCLVVLFVGEYMDR